LPEAQIKVARFGLLLRRGDAVKRAEE
jgi:hypothetical protein